MEQDSDKLWELLQEIVRLLQEKEALSTRKTSRPIDSP